VKVRIDKIEADSGRIGLSFRDTMEHPWENIESEYHAGSVASGVVSRIADFGAFVR